MAKRYYSSEELAEISGKFKPAGTLGKHFCTVVHQNKKMIVVGSVEGRVTLCAGDTLGYDCGKVWLVPKPESYNDPIRRVLALAKISQKVLEFSDEDIMYSVSAGGSMPNSCADVERGSSLLGVLGKHEDKYLPETRWDEESQPGWRGGFSFDQKVIGGEAIVVQRVCSNEPATYRRSRKVTRIIVRKNVDKKKVADWLEELLTPEGQERKKQREAKEKAAIAAKDESDLAKAKKLWDIIVPSPRFKYPWNNHFEFQGVRYEISHNPNRIGEAKLAHIDKGYVGGDEIHLLKAYRSGLLAAWVAAAQEEKC